MLHLFRSNYLEVLGETLASKLESEPIEDPIRSEWIAVNNPNMAQWISERLSLRLGVEPHRNRSTGICANVRFPFVSRCIREMCASVLGDEKLNWQDASDPWQGDALAFWVQKGIGELAVNDCFRSIVAYFAEENVGNDALVVEDRRFSLARRIADVFQQYLTYRPDWLHYWFSSKSDWSRMGMEKIPKWQPLLWNWLCDRIEQTNPATRLLDSIEQLRTGNVLDPSKLPPRISFFGLHTLPPFQLKFLHQLASHFSIDLYVLVPSHVGLSLAEASNQDRVSGAQLSLGFEESEADKQWPGLSSGSSRSSSKSTNGVLALSTESLANHRLTASLGRLSQDFRKIIEECVNESWVVQDAAFVDPVGVAKEAKRNPSLLERLQSDILQGQSDDQASGAKSNRVTIPVDDNSIEVHACYGPMRQVEVLRERIVDALHRDPELETRDILVLCPDLQRYAPLVATVFADGDPRWGAPVRTEGEEQFAASTEIGLPQLPISIVEQDLRSHNPIFQALWQLFDLVHSRHEVSSILDFLALDFVREKFSMEVEDLRVLVSMIQSSNIRWGRDGEHRMQVDGAPQISQRLRTRHSWRHGLSQLLSSVVMSNESAGSFFGVVPCTSIEGGRIELLGRFVHFCETLFRFTETFESPATLGQWMQRLRQAIGDLVDVPFEQPWLHQPFETALGELAKIEASSEWLPQNVISAAVLQQMLSKIIDSMSARQPIRASAIVCASMQHVSAVPYKLICFLGMDDGRFPRTSPSSGFDGVALYPRAGDRSLREDDRYAFFAALLAARSQIVVFYGAKDIRTRAEYPSAGPVADLMAVIERSFDHDPSFESIRDQISHNHPLHACDPRNFAMISKSNPRPIRSFDRRQFRAAQELLRKSCEEVAYEEAPNFGQHQNGARVSSVFMPRPLAPDAELEDAKTVALEELRRFIIHPTRFLMQRRLGLFLHEYWQPVENRDPFELDGLQKWQLGNQWLDVLRKGTSSERLRDLMRARGDLPIGTMGTYAWSALRPVVENIAEEGRIHSDKKARKVEIDVEVGDFRLQGQISSVYRETSANGEGEERRILQFAKLQPRHCLSMWIDHLAWTLEGAKRGAGGDRLVSTLVARGPELKPKVWKVGFKGVDIEDSGQFSEQQLVNLLRLWQRGHRELVPLFEQSSEAIAKEMRKSGDIQKSKTRALNCWGGDFSPQGGEGQDPYLQLAYGSLSNVDFSPWIDTAMTVWDPLLRIKEQFRG